MSAPNKTRVQVATDPAFSEIIHDVEGAYTTSLQVAEGVLPTGVNLYTRGMHGHPTTGDSSWSDAVQFSIYCTWLDWDGSDFGTSFIYNGNIIYSPTLVKLDATRAMVIYRDATAGTTRAVVLVVSGTVITKGTTYTVDAAAEYTFITSALVSTNKVLIAYRERGGSGGARCLTVSGTVITIGTEYLFRTAGYVAYVSVKMFSSTKAVLCFNHTDTSNVNRTKLIAITIAGNVLTFGNELNLFVFDTTYCNVVVLDSTRVLVAATDSTNGRQVVVAASVSGTTFTAGNTYSILVSGFCQLVKMTSGRILVVHSVSYVTVLDVVGLVISTYHSESIPSVSSWYNFSTVNVGDSKFTITYVDATDGHKCKALALRILNDNDITVGDVVEVSNAYSNTNGNYFFELSAHMADNRLLVIYALKDSGYIGYAKVLVG